MKSLTTSEKYSLIRHHAECLGLVGMTVSSRSRSELIESAERIIALLKSVPKIEFGDE